MARVAALALWLLCASGLRAGAGPPPAPSGASCLDRFTPGVPDFVLDTEASVSNGATFLGSPAARRGWDCVRACCTTPGCTLALAELQPDGSDDAIAACFLINCLYEQSFVCKFAPRQGFVNYLTREVYRSYRELRTQGFGGKREGSGTLRDLVAGCVLAYARPLKVALLQPAPHFPLVCSATCSPSEFRCADGCCVDSFLECDGTSDCLDASDEANCQRYINGFEDLQNIPFTSDKGHCVDLPDTGQCEARIPRWYYDPFSQNCARFTYGGCNGNGNNFEEEQQCLESCKGVSKKDVFGLRRESPISSVGSVEVAVGVLLATCIVVMVALLGYCFFKNQRKGFHQHQPPPTPASSTISTTEDMEHLVYNHTTQPF
ncbi:kunitz-type protease inhibitor 1 [Erinaceus europaeus]|uniref:Kunitz-type protease inhibitor 1 n=1 Tax=Erinaceus europaeus TaxID=9365 RepID=A0ABM3W0R7_ERIEU|nr:kunitz-type protease inhibitor 1 [Erinaceus europaeus]